MVTETQAQPAKVEVPPDAPGKMALDDYIVAFGPDAFRQLVESTISGQSVARSLDDYRAEMTRSRLDSIGIPGQFLDTSETGTGKTYADQQAAAAAGSSLLIHPSHDNCREVEADFQAAGLLAVAYPQLNEKTCQNLPVAQRALDAGLSPTDAVCTAGCPFLEVCDYHETMEEAEAASHRVACHKRAELSFKKLAEGRAYISIHEESTDLLCPKTEISRGLESVETVCYAALKAEQARIQIQPDLSTEYFYHQLVETCRQLQSYLDSANQTESIELPPSAVLPPPHLDRELWNVMQTCNTFPPGDCVRLVKAIAKGDVVELVVRVDEVFKQGGGKRIGRSILGVCRNKLPDKATIWFNNATGDPAEIEQTTGRPVVNRTPAGRVQSRQPILQIPLDVKRSTARKRFVEILRAVLLSLPQYERVGVICDRSHLPAIDGTAKDGIILDAELRARIAKTGYFRDGTSRGSNGWHEVCDLLLVVGTPRVPPSAVKTRLVQQGKIQAAKRPEEWISWGWDFWAGFTLSGRCQVVRCSGYRDHDWHAAYRAIVASELIQAIGRGRAILDNGIPVICLSNEPLGLPLADREVSPMTEAEKRILDLLREATYRKSSLQGQSDETEADAQRKSTLQGQSDAQRKRSLNNIYLESACVSTAELSEASSTTPQNVRLMLSRLCDRRLVEKIGERGGWRLSERPPIVLTKPAAGPGDVAGDDPGDTK
jgi:hypothetical protein